MIAQPNCNNFAYWLILLSDFLTQHIMSRKHTEPDQSSVMKPCPNKLQFSEVITDNDTIFQQSENDNKPAMSIEDKAFLYLVNALCPV
jgi:hypothetical protein